MTHERVFPVGCVIIGAGAGTRFGQPKAGALLEDGRRFVDAVYKTARDAGLFPIVTVLPPDTGPPNGAVNVVNRKSEGEQVVSLRLGLTQLANQAVVGAVAWPVDHPFVLLESVLAVLDAAKRSGAPIVAPEFEGERGHPVFFHRDTWRELLTVADGGAKAVVHAYGDRVVRIPVRDPGIHRDIDTPGDLTPE